MSLPSVALPTVVAFSNETPKADTAHDYVVLGQTRHYRWEGRAPLSIRTFNGGHGTFDTTDGMHRVEDGSYLVLNRDRKYSALIESEQPVNAFSIFFRPGFADQVYQELTTSHESMLSDGGAACIAEIEFFERLYGNDEVLERLNEFHREILPMRADKLWMQEKVHGIMRCMLDTHARTWREVEGLSAIRATTREDLYRRLYKARDFAHAMLDTPVTLDDMAKVACLSPSYFLRAFKDVFHETPHQYLTGLRLERAKRLLQATEHSVTEICLMVGFESLGSFSWLFKKRIGVSPEGYRKQVRSKRLPDRLKPLDPSRQML